MFISAQTNDLRAALLINLTITRTGQGDYIEGFIGANRPLIFRHFHPWTRYYALIEMLFPYRETIVTGDKIQVRQ